MRQETGRRLEAGDRRRGTGGGTQETGDRHERESGTRGSQETGDGRHGEDSRQKKGDGRQKKGDGRQKKGDGRQKTGNNALRSKAGVKKWKFSFF